MEKFTGRKFLPHLVGPRLSWLVAVVALVVSGALLGAGVEPDELDNAASGLPTDAESVRASAAAQDIVDEDVTVVLVVLDREGESLTGEDRAAAEQLLGDLGDLAAEGSRPFPTFADDGEAALIGVPLSSDLSEEDRNATVEELRERLSGADLPDGLRAQVTGGPAFGLDISQVFDGADVRLLAATASVVALLLLLTYRSPWLWLVPLAVVAIGDQVAGVLVAIASRVFPFATDGASTGITAVLVFGAGTNYALLLIARYREELRRTDDRYDAMRRAIDRAGPAILASAGTVALALLCLGFAETPFNQNIGYSGAIGITTAVVYALFVLPAAMTCFGRRLFWPFVPRVGSEDPTRNGVWAGIGKRVTARPVTFAAASVAVIAALAVPALGIAVGLSDTEQFLDEPESVRGQQVLAEHFPAGSSQPTTVVVSTEARDDVQRAVTDLDSVRSVEPAGERGEQAVLNVVLNTQPASDEALSAIESIRETVADEMDGALVGGADAEAFDAQAAADRDQRVVVPLILGVVLLVLLVLLKSIVATVLLTATVVATYVASLGASWLAFEGPLGFPALDVSVPLLSFLFLVALGVDYNIFLVTRAKEEAEDGADTTTSISVALAVTGGVITSAGIVLAAVFTVLGVLPLIVLAQIGVIVGFGVLLDTLLVRTVLVPALFTLLGRRAWWPGPLSRSR